MNGNDFNQRKSFQNITPAKRVCGLWTDVHLKSVGTLFQQVYLPNFSSTSKRGSPDHSHLCFLIRSNIYVRNILEVSSLSDLLIMINDCKSFYV